MRFLRQSLLGLFLLSLTLGVLAVAGYRVFDAVQSMQDQGGFRPPARERVFAVNVVDAQLETIAPVLTAFGEVASRRTLEVRATSGGQLVFVAPEFEDGGQVQAGQVLARVDPSDAQAQLDRVRADILDAEAESRDAARAVALAQDDLAAAIEQADLRDRALVRQQDLRERGVGTEAAVEAAELSASSARASVLGRRQALANAEARVDQAQTRIARQQIALAEAERTLADTEIAAGFDGSLSAVSVVEGRLVSPNEKLAELIDPDSLEVSFRISTAQYARLLGPDGDVRKAPVEVVLDVGGEELVSQGRITRDSAAVGDGQTGRLVYASLDTLVGLKPGDFVTVRVEEPPVQGVTRLPASALGNDGAVLIVREDNRLEALGVELVRRQGDDVLVRADGLAEKRVVAERTPLLGAGIGVRVNGDEPPESAGRPSGQGRPDGQPGGQGGRPDRAGGGAGGDMIALDEDRRAKLIAAVEGNARMPADAKARILEQLKQPEVPRDVVERLESRMGG